MENWDEFAVCVVLVGNLYRYGRVWIVAPQDVCFHVWDLAGSGFYVWSGRIRNFGPFDVVDIVFVSYVCTDGFDLVLHYVAVEDVYVDLRYDSESVCLVEPLGSIGGLRWTFGSDLFVAHVFSLETSVSALSSWVLLCGFLHFIDSVVWWVGCVDWWLLFLGMLVSHVRRAEEAEAGTWWKLCDH